MISQRYLTKYCPHFEHVLVSDQQENEQAASTSRSSKCRRLEDLFRPPIDLMFKGSFHSVSAGQLSNIQSLVQAIFPSSLSDMSKVIGLSDNVRHIIDINWNQYVTCLTIRPFFCVVTNMFFSCFEILAK